MPTIQHEERDKLHEFADKYANFIPRAANGVNIDKLGILMGEMLKVLISIDERLEAIKAKQRNR